MRFRRRQYKDHVFGRFFQRLQQRVKGRGRQHVHLVDDIDLVARLAGTKPDLVADRLTHIVHTGVRGRIHLDQVQKTTFVDRLADVAAIAGPIDHILVHAVNGLGQQTGHRRLACTARPGKQVGMRDSPPAHGIPEGACNVLLADDVLEPSRAPLEVQSQRGHELLTLFA